ncbi:cytochrome b561 and DOMON domain-containing protein At4g17280-like [Coffea arabica]|uniref:Cytochrome b561 and DOMON domain-containing protein At4g17280-like n=1 Tax=Coffea arabica TaxID=13443 RepID=A0A6P6UCJ1_COFAR
MGATRRCMVIVGVLFALFLSSTSAQSCSKYKFAGNKVFSTCSDLPYLNSNLHWMYSPSSQSLEIAFRCMGTSSSRWVSWAINPTSQGMVGSQALVAFQKSDGTMRAYTSPIKGYQTRLQEGDLSFPVSDLSAIYLNNEMIIFATLKLQNSSSTLNQVWQEGPLSYDSPGMHPTTGHNVQSMGTLNLLSGESKTTAGASSSKLNCPGNPSTSAQSCSKYKFAGNKVFSTCSDLPYLNSYLHWTYSPSSQSLEIAFRCMGTSSSRWVSWAINPTSQGMVGSQSLVAFQKSDGTMRAYTSPIKGYQTRLQEGDLSFPVSDLSAIYSNNEMIIFATLKLQNSSSTLNQVWQEGPLSNDSPGMHPTTGPNVQSMGTLNLLSGESKTTAGASSSKLKSKNIHGVLNAVSWGILMPLGAIIARYVKEFPLADPAWFYLHVTCQLSAFILGVAGFGTGLHLGSQSPGVAYAVHRGLGIAVFTLALVQVSALFIRPKKDHKWRSYWNYYHYLVGYGILGISIANIFKGLDILSPAKIWKRAYIGILVTLASLALLLEVIVWFLKRRKRSAGADRSSHGTNETV